MGTCVRVAWVWNMQGCESVWHCKCSGLIIITQFRSTNVISHKNILAFESMDQSIDCRIDQHPHIISNQKLCFEYDVFYVIFNPTVCKIKTPEKDHFACLSFHAQVQHHSIVPDKMRFTTNIFHAKCKLKASHLHQNSSHGHNKKMMNHSDKIGEKIVISSQLGSLNSHWLRGGFSFLLLNFLQLHKWVDRFNVIFQVHAKSLLKHRLDLCPLEAQNSFLNSSFLPSVVLLLPI